MALTIESKILVGANAIAVFAASRPDPTWVVGRPPVPLS
jgi:hypothetical protein